MYPLMFFIKTLFKRINETWHETPYYGVVRQFFLGKREKNQSMISYLLLVIIERLFY